MLDAPVSFDKITSTLSASIALTVTDKAILYMFLTLTFWTFDRHTEPLANIVKSLFYYIILFLSIFYKHSPINGNKSLARASWKRKVGYHAKSLVESTMLQIKQHCRDNLTNKKEQNRIIQSQIKCKIVNLIIAA